MPVPFSAEHPSPHLLVLGQTGQTLGQEIQVIQINVLSDYGFDDPFIPDLGQFVPAVPAVLDPGLLEGIIESSSSRRQLQRSGRFISPGAVIADLCLEDLFSQGTSLLSAHPSEARIGWGPRRVHPSPP